MEKCLEMKNDLCKTSNPISTADTQIHFYTNIESKDSFQETQVSKK
jgi:hypothetical protein